MLYSMACSSGMRHSACQEISAGDSVHQEDVAKTVPTGEFVNSTSFKGLQLVIIVAWITRSRWVPACENPSDQSSSLGQAVPNQAIICAQKVLLACSK